MQMQLVTKVTQEQMGAGVNDKSATLTFREVIQPGQEQHYNMVGPSTLNYNATLAQAADYDVGTTYNVTFGLAPVEE